MKAFLLLLTLSFAVPTLALAARGKASLPYGALHVFTTDACTHFPDGTDEQPTGWQFCCVKHDLKYWAGGSSEARSLADQELSDCVEKSGHPDIARTMLAGVRVGGSPYFANPWRWGYGWEQLRAYSELTSDELAEVRKLTPPDLSKVPIVKLP